MSVSRLAVRAAILACVAMGSLSAQGRPNFSGDWMRAPDSVAIGRTVAATGDAAFRLGDMGSGWGATLTMAHRPDSLVIEYDFFSAYDLQPRVRLAYVLDGSESRNGVMIGHAESVQRSTVSWQGSALVITTRTPAPAGEDGRATTSEVRHALTLEPTGSLAVETTRVGVFGGPTTATRVVYTKR